MLVTSELIFPEGIGGRERFVPEISQAISQHGINVTCICYSGGLLPKRFIRAGVRYYSVPRLTHLAPFINGMITLPLMVLTGLLLNVSSKFDVLYCHSFVNPAAAGFILGRLISRPYIVVMHGTSEFLMIDTNRVLNAVCRKVLQKASIIITVSRELASRFREVSHSYGIATDAAIEPGGVSKSLIQWVPERHTLQMLRQKYVGDADFTILSVGRIVPEKGFDIILKSICLLKVRFPRLRAVIVGSGPQLASLKAQVDQLKISENVFFTGKVSDDDLKYLISLSDLCVISSRTEGTPLRLFEYMALGKPVIATAVGGIPDVITDSACLVEPENPLALANALTTLLSRPDECARIGSRNRLGANEYAWNRVAERTLNIMSTYVKR